MTKILILGIGNAQVDALEYLKGIEDVEVYACSYVNEGAGKKYIDDDKFALINIVDIASIKAYIIENKIDIVYSVGSDIALTTIANVSADLEMPCFITPEIANICNNKQVMRAFLGDDFKGNLKYREAKCIEEIRDWDVYPAILKPTDSQGQRGITVVNSFSDIEKAFDHAKSYSKTGTIILEDYIEGQEYSINAYVYDGEPVVALPSERFIYSEYPGGIPSSHRFLCSAIPNDVREELIDLAKRVITKIGIENGPVYFQVKVGVNGAKLIEVTPRLDGCHMWRLVKVHCGIDLLKASLEQLLFGKKPEFLVSEKLTNCETRFISLPPGTCFAKPKLNEAEYNEVVYYYEDGDKVAKINGFMEKCGYTIKEIK